MRFRAPTDPAVTRLSDVDRRWRTRANVWGDRPEIDYAVSAPWRLFGPPELAAVRSLVEQHRHLAWRNARALTLRGIEPLCRLFGAPRLAAICSELAGLPLAAHPMRFEHCHVNLQAADDDAPVDGWHQDYVPFVLVCVIARDGGPPPGEVGSGRLVTRDAGAFALEPGDAVLMQGSHVWHMAERVVGGDRITAVLSLAPAGLDLVDGTRVFRDRPPYHPDEPLPAQCAAYRRANLRALARMAVDCEDDDRRAWLLRRMAFEQARLDEATGAAPARGAPPWIPQRRGAPSPGDLTFKPRRRRRSHA